jgi:hypothetical protein
MPDICPSCGTAVGKFHEPFCNRELCPFCDDFITTCDCIFEVLSLTAEEHRVVEEFEDDSCEPLRGICNRWNAAVEAKGRVPYAG